MSVTYHSHLNVPSDVESDIDEGDKLSSDSSDQPPASSHRTRPLIPRSSGSRENNSRPATNNPIAGGASKASIQQRVFPIECHFWYRGGAAQQQGLGAPTTEALPQPTEADTKSVNAEVWLVKAPRAHFKAEEGFEIQIFCLERKIRLETIPFLALGHVAPIALPRGGATSTSLLSNLGYKHDSALYISCADVPQRRGEHHCWIKSAVFAGKAASILALQSMLNATFAAAQRVRAQHESAPSQNPRLLSEMQRAISLQERARKFLEDGNFALGAGIPTVSSAADSPQRDIRQAINALSGLDVSATKQRRVEKGRVTKRKAIPAGISMEYLQRCGLGVPSNSAPFVDELSEVESLPSLAFTDDDDE